MRRVPALVPWSATSRSGPAPCSSGSSSQSSSLWPSWRAGEGDVAGAPGGWAVAGAVVAGVGGGAEVGAEGGAAAAGSGGGGGGGGGPDERRHHRTHTSRPRHQPPARPHPPPTPHPPTTRATTT